MNAAVIYSSKTGTSARCAARLAEHLEADLLEISGDFPDIAAYDAVLLGGGVRMGRLPRPLRRWTALHTGAADSRVNLSRGELRRPLQRGQVVDYEQTLWPQMCIRDRFELDGELVLVCCPQGVPADGWRYRNPHQCEIGRASCRERV